MSTGFPGSNAVYPPTVNRRDLLGLLAGAALAAAFLAASAAAIDADRVSSPEADVFIAVNDLPGSLYPVAWPVMQLGNLFVVPAVAVIAAATKRFRLALAAASSGVAVWLLAKVIKEVAERGRPAELLADVELRNAPAAGGGFVSGHAAVAFAMATVATPYLGRWGRVIAWTLATAVGVARVYVGAHLPLDVVGGAAFGVSVGLLANALFGTRAASDADDRSGTGIVPSGERR